MEAAAAQIAAEEQLSPVEQAALAQKLLAHVSGRPSSATGSVAAGCLSPERPRNPIKGHGACNPEVEFMPSSRVVTGGIQYMPHMGGSHARAKLNNPGAAGLASSENWRSTHNYMANGAEGYGDFRSEHLALQPHANNQARNLQPKSNVVFGTDPRM